MARLLVSSVMIRSPNEYSSMLSVGLLVTLAQQHRHGHEQHACARHLSTSLEQDALDELRKDRRDLHLHVPLLSGDPGMHRHVLHRELNFDGQTPKLHNLTQAEPDGDRPDVLETARSSRPGYYRNTRGSSPPKKIDAMGCRFIWFVSCRKCCPPMDHHCWGNTPMKYCFVR